MEYKKNGQSDSLVKDIKVLICNPCVQGPEDVKEKKEDLEGKLRYMGMSAGKKNG